MATYSNVYTLAYPVNLKNMSSQGTYKKGCSSPVLLKKQTKSKTEY